MIHQTITKAVLAIVFTLVLTFGAGLIADQIGVSMTQPAYACGSHNGGGC